MAFTKDSSPESLWIICKKCDTAFHPGGKCKCGNIETRRDKDGRTLIIADDSDDVVYDPVSYKKL